MLRSKWHSLLLNLVSLYLADVTDTRWPLERAVYTKCADTRQATGAWKSASIICLITGFFFFSLSLSPARRCEGSGSSELILMLIRCKRWKVNEGQPRRVLCTCRSQEPAVDQHCLTASGLGARREQTAPDLLAKSHPGFQVNEQKKGFISRGQQWCASTGCWEAAEKVPKGMGVTCCSQLVSIKWQMQEDGWCWGQRSSTCGYTEVLFHEGEILPGCSMWSWLWSLELKQRRGI